MPPVLNVLLNYAIKQQNLCKVQVMDFIWSRTTPCICMQESTALTYRMGFRGKENCWERQSYMHTLLIHSWLNKNEPWGLEDFFFFFFLLREIVSSQSVLDLALCVTISSPVSDLVCTLFCLSMCVIWHLVSPTVKSVPCREETSPLFFVVRGVHEGQWHCNSGWRDQLGMGDQCPLLELILLYLFAM